MKLNPWIVIAVIGGSMLCPARADWVDDYGRLLAKYVTPAGVKYSAWKNEKDDLAALKGVVGAIGAAKAPEGNGREALAFYINAYNAWILHEALEKYPTKSVKDTLFTFFTTNRITVGGGKMSFNKLEKEIILARFREPRAHFALNCASKSCPPLSPEPFRGKNLDVALDDLGKAFVNSDRGVKTVRGTNEYQLSKIFDWYMDDFASLGGVIKTINGYRRTPVPENAKITYQNYDWSLNEAR